MKRTRGRRLAAGVAAVAALAVALSVFAGPADAGRDALTLSPVSLCARPYTLVTYTLAHAGVWHAVVNAAALVAGGAYMILKRRAALLLPLVLLSAILSGLAFCGAAYVAGHDRATLVGASAPAFALAAYASVYGRHRLLAVLLAALALAGLFGPNAGGAVAHCAGFATGAAAAWLDLRRGRRKAAGVARRREALRRKVHVSGYASLTDDERRQLTSDTYDS